MNCSGRLIVLGIFAVSFAMAGFAWWHRFNQSRQAAAYWGHGLSQLMVSDSSVDLIKVDGGDESRPHWDLTDREGLVHLRHALTLDASFEWAGRQREPWSESEWGYALAFTRGGETGVIYFRDQFNEVTAGGASGMCETLPCPRLGAGIRRYLSEVGVTLPAEEAATAPR